MRETITKKRGVCSPRQQRKASNNVAAANSFGAVASEWFERQRSVWSSRHAERIWRRIEQDVLPWLGHRPLSDIRPPEVLRVLRRIEERGAIETAHRLLQYCGKIFRYAVATGRIDSDPCRDLHTALRPVQDTHLAAITEPDQVARLLRAMQGYEASLVVRTSLRLAPLVFVRPGELRKARWRDIDFERCEWRYDVSKTGTQHIVPLSRQALNLLKEVQPLTGTGEYVFPSSRGRGRPMSENTLSAALRALGYDGSTHTVHGFRAMARTLLDEELGFAPHLIEHQLGHRVKDALGRAYNRTKHLPERHEMMQRWADYLEQLQDD